MSHTTPQLTFFCELEARPLQEFFANPEVMAFLQETGAAVSLGIIDFSPERVEVVRGLNEANIPVTAWLLLPEEEGYWFNLDNAPQAEVRYETFQAWSIQNHLKWARVGLDIEPDRQTLQSLPDNWLAGLKRLTRQFWNSNRLRRGKLAYERLVRRIKKDGHVVETYQFPFIQDERVAKSSLLQRATGLVDLRGVDVEVYMLYSSFARQWGQAAIQSYGPTAGGIAVGSTGGGVEMEGVVDTRPLTWDELQADLRLAAQYCSQVYIFSLEGCQRQGFLPRLKNFDWRQPVTVFPQTAQQVRSFRRVLQGTLWLLSRPALLLLPLVLFAALVGWRRKQSH